MQSSSSASTPSIVIDLATDPSAWSPEIRNLLYAADWDQPLTINGKEYPTLWVWCCRHNIDLWSALLPPSQNESEKLEHEKAVVKKVLDLNWTSQYDMGDQDSLSLAHALLLNIPKLSLSEALLRIDQAGVCQKFLGIKNLDLQARIEGKTVSLWLLFMQPQHGGLVEMLLASFRDEFLQQILALDWGEVKEQCSISSSCSFAHGLLSFTGAEAILEALLKYHPESVCEQFLRIGDLDSQMQGKRI